MTVKPNYEETYYTWKQDQTPENLSKAVTAYTGLLHSELPKYTTSNLNPTVIKGYGKKIIADSLKSYDPAKGKLANHIVTNLQRLHRINYESSSFFRLAEEMQRGTTLFRNAKTDLTDTLKREPNTEELSDYLKWNPSKVRRMDRTLMKETLSDSLGYAPAYVAMDDPKIDYLYHDLDPQDKIIFEFKTGYKGSPVLRLEEISKKTGLSVPMVSIRAGKIANQLNQVFKTHENN